jgi:hypothetical protein
METGTPRGEGAAPPLRRGAVVLVVAAVAFIGGLGALTGRAAPARPTSFEVQHERILSIVGSHESSVQLAHKVRLPGYSYATWEELGTARVAFNVRAQRGNRFEIDAFTVEPGAYDPYEGYDGGDYGDDGGDDTAAKAPRTAADGKDELPAGAVVVGKLRYRLKRARRDYGNYVTENVEWKSTAKLRHGTRVALTGNLNLGYVDGGEYDAGSYGEFLFGPRSKQSGGATATLAGGETTAFIRGLRIQTTAGTLHCDVTWIDAQQGTVTFTAPESLAGLTGRIRAGNRGTWSITGPKGNPVRIQVRDDGSGTVDLGVGKFRVSEGGFQLTYE